MAEKNYQDAVQALKARIGGRWEGNEADGRGEMVDILRNDLGFSSAEANDAIDAMVASNQLRYHTTTDTNAQMVGAPPGEPGSVPPPLTPPGEGMVTGIPATGGLGGMPLAPGMIPAAGYWEVGDSSDDEAAPGRAGQVTPDGL